MLLAHQEQVRAWVAGDGKDAKPLSIVKIEELLARQGVVVPYGTLHRFATERCGYRVKDPHPRARAALTSLRTALRSTSSGMSVFFAALPSELTPTSVSVIIPTLLADIVSVLGQLHRSSDSVDHCSVPDSITFLP